MAMIVTDRGDQVHPGGEFGPPVGLQPLGGDRVERHGARVEPHAHRRVARLPPDVAEDQHGERHPEWDEDQPAGEPEDAHPAKRPQEGGLEAGRGRR